MSAARHLINAILKGDASTSQIWDIDNLPQTQGVIASSKGIGAPLIEKFLEGVPGMNKSAVKHQLANLKASGDYPRIVKEVTAELEEERAAGLRFCERWRRIRR